MKRIELTPKQAKFLSRTLNYSNNMNLVDMIDEVLDSEEPLDEDEPVQITMSEEQYRDLVKELGGLVSDLMVMMMDIKISAKDVKGGHR